MAMEESELARAAILEIVENQIAGDDPPESRQTLERLIAEGYSEVEAKRLIGCVAVSEIFTVLKEGRAYDAEAYIDAL